MSKVGGARDTTSSEIQLKVYYVYNSKDDITTMFEDGLTKVVEGLTTMEEILKTVDISSDEELNV